MYIYILHYDINYYLVHVGLSAPPKSGQLFPTLTHKVCKDLWFPALPCIPRCFSSPGSSPSFQPPGTKTKTGSYGAFEGCYNMFLIATVKSISN